MTLTRSGGRSQCMNAVGVRGRLHKKGGGISKSGFQEWAEVKAEEPEIFLVTREGAVGDATAGEDDGDIAFAGFAQEVGPDFSFENDDESGLHGVENPADAEAPIERKVNHGVGEWHAFFRKRVAGLGGGGYNQGTLRIRFFETLGQRDSGKRFADRHGVNPDSTGAVRWQAVCGGGYEAEAVAEVGKIFSVADALNQPIRCREQGRETHQYAINEVHSIWTPVRSGICERPRSNKQGQPCFFPMNRRPQDANILL